MSLTSHWKKKEHKSEVSVSQPARPGEHFIPMSHPDSGGGFAANTPCRTNHDRLHPLHRNGVHAAVSAPCIRYEGTRRSTARYHAGAMESGVDRDAMNLALRSLRSLQFGLGLLSGIVSQ